jgi:hypothetical protein
VCVCVCVWRGGGGFFDFSSAFASSFSTHSSHTFAGGVEVRKVPQQRVAHDDDERTVVMA